MLSIRLLAPVHGFLLLILPTSPSSTFNGFISEDTNMNIVQTRATLQKWYASWVRERDYQKTLEIKRDFIKLCDVMLLDYWEEWSNCTVEYWARRKIETL